MLENKHKAGIIDIIVSHIDAGIIWMTDKERPRTSPSRSLSDKEGSRSLVDIRNTHEGGKKEGRQSREYFAQLSTCYSRPIYDSPASPSREVS